MPSRGPQTFKKRQKEQQRKDRQQEKMAKRLARKDGTAPPDSEETEDGTAFEGQDLEPEASENTPSVP